MRKTTRLKQLLADKKLLMAPEYNRLEQRYQV